jgi:hypothetical protein
MLEAFNDNLVKTLNPGAYLVIDESMNQWLGYGIPNFKKVPRKPHPIGQEFKTIVDCHTNCFLRLDTVSDPCLKKFDEPNVAELVATVKRLCDSLIPFRKNDNRRILVRQTGNGDNAAGSWSLLHHAVVKTAYWARGHAQA